MSHLIPYRIEKPLATQPKAEASHPATSDSLAVDSLTTDTLAVDSLAMDSLQLVEPTPASPAHIFWSDLNATEQPSTRYREVSPEELFGTESVQAEMPFLEPRHTSPIATGPFGLLTLAILLFYCLMLYQHLGDATLLISRVTRERATGERLSEDANGGYSHFLTLTTTLGLLLLGVVTMRLTAPMLHLTPLAAWPETGAFIGALGVAVALCGVTLYQLIVCAVAGRITYTQHLFEQLFLLKRTFFALLTLLATPFTLLWLLTPADTGTIWFWVIIIELVLSLILYLQETLSLFISKKISILHWFLYLCGVEIFPLSLLILWVVR